MERPLPIPVQELEKRKVFEIARGELLAIKLKEHVFNASQIEFTTQDKKKRALRILDNGTFRHVKHALQVFSPELIL